MIGKYLDRDIRDKNQIRFTVHEGDSHSILAAFSDKSRSGQTCEVSTKDKDMGF